MKEEDLQRQTTGEEDNEAKIDCSKVACMNVPFYCRLRSVFSRLVFQYIFQLKKKKRKGNKKKRKKHQGYFSGNQKKSWCFEHASRSRRESFEKGKKATESQ